MSTSNTNSKVRLTFSGTGAYEIPSVGVNAVDVSLDSLGNAENIDVILLDSAGEETTLTETTHYTLSGRTVTITDGDLAGSILVLHRNTPLTNEDDFQENEPFPASSFNDALDKATFQNQVQQEELDRAIKQPITDATSSLTLPTATARAGMALVFDDDGDIDVSPAAIPKTWSVGRSYDDDAIVQYGGYLFKSLQAANLGNTPDSSTPGDTEYWELFQLSDLAIDAVDLADGTTATTQSKGDGSTKVATTLYVDEAGGGAQFDLASGSYTIASPAAGMSVAYDPGTDDFVKDDRDEGAYITIGMIKSVSVADTITVATSGLVEGLSGLVTGTKYYNSSTPGEYTTTTSNTTRCVALGVAVSTTQMLVQINPFEYQNPDNKDIGDIFPSARTTAPAGSLACDGAVYSRTIYADLYAAIGLTWSKTWEDDEVVAAGAYRKDVAGTSLYTTVAGGTSSGTDIGDDSGVTWVAADSVFQVPDARGAHFVGAGTNATYKMADGNYYEGPAVGSFEDDQFQSHLVKQVGGIDTAGTINYSSATYPLWITAAEAFVEDKYNTASASYGSGELFAADPTNGTPRTGDETRPFAAGVLWCIKASKLTSSGQAVDALYYDTGWVAVSDCTDVQWTVTHNLDAKPWELITEVWLADDDTPTNPQKVESLAWAWDQTPAGSISYTYGISIQEGADDNSFKLVTCAQGLKVIDSADGTFTTYVTDAAYFVRVYKPQILNNVSLPATRTVSADYTVQAQDCETIYVDCATPSDDVEIDLVSIAGNLGRRITIRMKDSDSGTYQAIINPATDEAIAGLAANTAITLSSDRDYWTLEAGPDRWELVAGYETISGDNDGVKRADGTMEQWGVQTNHSFAGSSTATAAVTLAESFVDTNYVVNATTENPDDTAEILLVYGSKRSATTSGFSTSLAEYSGTNKTLSNVDVSWHAVGRWY